MVRSRMAWLMVAAAMMLFVSCHTITEESPTEPTEVAADPPVMAITIPLILPASNPAPTPAPTATAPPVPGTGPTPTPGTPPAPTPPPPPPPSGGSCSLGGGDPNHTCSRTSHTFLHDVDLAIDRVVASRPGIFDLGDDVCGGCYRIKDHDAYVAAVKRELERMGYCAHYDGEEMAVKNINAFNDQYDISTSSGYVRRGDKSYRSTCRPAWF